MKRKRPILKEAKYFIIFLFVKWLLFLSNLLPRKVLLNLCGALGKMAFYLVKDSRKKTLAHITLIFGHVKSSEEILLMAKRVFEMLGKNAADILRSVSMNDIIAFKKVVNVTGEEYLEKAFHSKKGVIVLTAHMGAFELVGTYLALMDYRPQIIGKIQKDPRLNRLLMDNRRKRNAEVIERGKDTLKVVRNLKSGGMVAMLIDQDTKVKSVFVDFMGKPASTPVGAALFALRTGAKVVPIGIHLDDKLQQQMTIYPEVPMLRIGNEEVDLVNNTLAFSKATELLINQDPTQWVWMHERWKTQKEKKLI
ncbi:lysophospholipid acyltransferase family protein [Shivajiella indica]|uniref:Lysophospholipid acyltransferase family protein n=1 Tax=Shivajiella indica TaxID=872115 RepID=A0ABW5B7R5_9BACT